MTAAAADWLTMPELAERAGIPYPTVARYVDRHHGEITSSGDGRRRRFAPEAVEQLLAIRAEAKPGRPPKPTSDGVDPDLVERLYRLELRILDLSEEVQDVTARLRTAGGSGTAV